MPRLPGNVAAGRARPIIAAVFVALVVPAAAAAQPALVADADPLDFGDQRVGVPVTGSLVLTNTGDTDATVTSLAIAGPDAAEFSIAATTPFTVVANGGSATVDVTFTPGATGARSATLTVDYDPGGQSLPVGLAGTGVAPDMVVTVVGGATPPLDFGSARVGTASSTTYTIRVDNAGTDVLSASLATTGANPGDWSYSPPATSFTVPAGGFYDVVATFTPAAAGARSATLTVADDDGLSATPSVDLAMTGTGTEPAISVSPDPIDFAGQRVFTSSAPRLVTISNTGTAPLTVTDIRLAAGDTGDFGLTTSLPMTIAPGSSGAFSVTFTPAAAGTRSSTIEIVSDAPTSPTLVTARGTGLAPVLAVSPTSLAFADTRVGSASATQTFTIDNAGDADMNVLSVSIPGANADDYTVTAFSGTIAPSDPPVTISVTFTPQLAGPQPATIVVTTDNPLPPASANVAVTGTGTEALLSLSPAAGYDFGDTRVGGQSGDGVFVLENIGTAPVTVSSLTLGAPDAGDFAIASAPALPFSIAPGASRTVSVRCRPGSVGVKSSSLAVGSDADNAASVPVPPLACNGVTPDIAVAPVSLSFGPQLVGTTSGAQTITVSNAGGSTSATLNVTVSTLGPAAADFSASPASFSVPPGGSQDVSVTFSPSAEGARTATVRFNSDDLDEPTVDVAVSGTGQKPEITLVDPAGGRIDFGAVNVSQSSAPAAITVRNDGSAPLTISGVAIAGGDAGEFAFTSGSIPPPDVVLAPGATATWQVVCTPSSTGAKSSSVRIASDDADEGVVVVPLDCEGVQAQLVVSPSPVAFPATRVCESAEPIAVRLENGGTAPLTITDVTVSMTTVFPIVTPWPSLPHTLAPGESLSFELGFTPAMHADYAGQIVIASDDPNAPTATVAVLGPGRVAAMELTPMSVAFDAVRVDRSPVTRTLVVKNTGTAPFVVGGLSVDNAADFSVNPVSPASLPARLDPAPAGPGGTGEELVYEVIAHPAALGPASGTVTVTTDIPSCLPVVASVPVSAEGVAPDMAVSPSAVDYGGHDVQAEFPKTRTVAVQNTGTAPLQVDAISISGPYANEFGLVDPPALPVVIPAGESLPLDVKFQPTVMRDCDATDPDAFIDIESDGFTVPMARVQLDGCGLDRIIALDTLAVPFPPTYRNPAAPPTHDITISNTGTFQLEVYATMTSDMDVFRVIGGGAMTIPVGESRTVTVEFHPTAASAVPFEGALTIANDDDGNPMAVVKLSGRGILPEVTCDPCSVSFGDTAVGSRATLTGRKLRINNMNPARSFTLRDVRVAGVDGGPVDDEAFAVIGFDGPVELPPMGGVDLDVAFSPAAPGRHMARIEVYLDADPLMQTFITVDGEGVAAHARGAGCAAAPAGRGASGALWLAIALVGLAVRRRRAVGATVAAAVVAVAATASADEPTRNIDLAVFRAAAGGDPTLLSVETPRLGAAGSWTLSLFADVARRPLAVEPMGAGQVHYPVANRATYELAADVAVGSRWEAGLRLPILSQSGDAASLNIEPAGGLALGDIALSAKASLIQANRFGLAMRAEVTVPTATDGEFAGADGPTGHARLIAGGSLGPVDVAGNAGYRLRGRARFVDLEQDDEVTFGLGAAVRTSPRWSWIAEVYGARGLGPGKTEGASPLEIAVGARYRVSRSFGVAAGVARGVLPGVGAAAARGVVLVSYAPGARPLAVPVRPPAPPIDRGDDDGDGVINAEDRCPDEAEDADGFEDADGCPDPDNDGDGVADADDACPAEAEDVDGFEDADGCPDPDNDGDGIPDRDDRCPMEVEDRDGFADGDGCDDPDNDRDGIPDVIDECAVEPETINGNEDDDGCPDAGDSAILEREDRVELIEPIQFRGTTAELTPAGERVLEQVARLIRARPEWARIRIGVHVHPRGPADDALARARAAAVRAWLVRWGIDGDRLVAKGYGSSRPLVPRNVPRARAVNDRVEFVVEQRTPLP